MSEGHLGHVSFVWCASEPALTLIRDAGPRQQVAIIRIVVSVLLCNIYCFIAKLPRSALHGASYRPRSALRLLIKAARRPLGPYLTQVTNYRQLSPSLTSSEATTTSPSSFPRSALHQHRRSTTPLCLSHPSTSIRHVHNVHCRGRAQPQRLRIHGKAAAREGHLPSATRGRCYSAVLPGSPVHLQPQPGYQ